jgi:hypothetical protein
MSLGDGFRDSKPLMRPVLSKKLIASLHATTSVAG